MALYTSEALVVRVLSAEAARLQNDWDEERIRSLISSKATKLYTDPKRFPMNCVRRLFIESKQVLFGRVSVDVELETYRLKFSRTWKSAIVDGFETANFRKTLVPRTKGTVAVESSSESESDLDAIPKTPASEDVQSLLDFFALPSRPANRNCGQGSRRPTYSPRVAQMFIDIMAKGSCAATVALVFATLERYIPLLFGEGYDDGKKRSCPSKGYINSVKECLPTLVAQQSVLSS